MTVRTLSVLLLLVSAAVTAGFAQAAPAFAPEALAKSLDSLEKDLAASGCVAERSACEDSADEKTRSLLARARDLGTALHLSSESLKGCKEVSLTRLHLDGAHEAGYVQTQCGVDLNLVFMVKEDESWRYLQTLVVPNRYHEARVTAGSVTGDNSQQVMVHRAQHQSRNGASHTSFVIYKLRGGGLEPILDLVESGLAADPWSQQEVSQRSEFTFRQNKETGPHFEETQIVSTSDLKIQLKREHMWAKDSQMFVATQWYSAQPLTPQKSKARAR